MANEITPGTCDDCGAEILSGKIEDPIGYMRDKKMNRDVVLDAEPTLPKADDLYVTHYTMGSGFFVDRVPSPVYRVHVCPKASTG